MDNDITKIFTVTKCAVAKLRYTVGNHRFFKTCTVRKCCFADYFYGIRKYYLFNFFTIPKSFPAYFFNTVGKIDLLKTGVVKGCKTYFRNIFRYRDVFKAFTKGKRFVTYLRNAFRNKNAFEISAKLKGGFADCNKVVRKYDTSQNIFVTKSIIFIFVIAFYFNWFARSSGFFRDGSIDSVSRSVSAGFVIIAVFSKLAAEVSARSEVLLQALREAIRQIAIHNMRFVVINVTFSSRVGQNSVFLLRYSVRSSILTRSCFIVSRSRTVTQPSFSRVSKSYVMQNGVPISS